MIRPNLIDKLDVLSRASVAEMLHEIEQTLARLKGCAPLSVAQNRHVADAHQHIEAAVAEWIDEVTGDQGAQATPRKHVTKSREPGRSGRGLDHVRAMLEIYRHDIGELDFTPMQIQRLMIAVHNLSMIAKEIIRRAH